MTRVIGIIIPILQVRHKVMDVVWSLDADKKRVGMKPRSARVQSPQSKMRASLNYVWEEEELQTDLSFHGAQALPIEPPPSRIGLGFILNLL